MTLPEPTLRHLQRMTDDTSLFEHAIGSLPHRALGYCTDDAGRGLAVAVRSEDAVAEELAERWLAFLVQAHDGDGRFRLRMGFDRRWTDDPSSDDACGRAIFGIGVAAAIAPWTHIGREARRLFELVAPFRSVYPRATAHAVVGAAELTVADAACVSARSLVEDGLASLPRGTDDDPLAVAGAPARVRERAAARGADRRRPRDRRRRRGGRGTPAAAMAGRRRDARRSLQLRAGRRPRPRRRRVPRSISNRSRRVRSRTPALARSRSRTTTRGSRRSAPAPDGSTGRTTWGSRCSIRRRAGASTGWRWTGSTRTRAPSRRSRSSPRCSARGCWRVARRFSERRGARPAADPPGPSRRRRTGPPLRT